MASSSHCASTSGKSGHSRGKRDDSRIFRAFICPVTHEIMHDPMMIVASNQTVQRAAAEKWFALGKSRCPVSGISLPYSRMVANKALQVAMRECDLGISGHFPRAFTCPVNSTIMRDPVLIVGSEQTISRTAFNWWRASSSSRFCPVTKKRLAHTTVCDNIALRKALEEWEEQHGAAPHSVYSTDHSLPSIQIESHQTRLNQDSDHKAPRMSKNHFVVQRCLLFSYILVLLATVVAVATSNIVDTKVILNEPERTLEEQLLLAAEHGDLHEIKRLISQGTSVDVQDEEGRSLIFLAAANKHVDAVELLIKLGADTEALTKRGETPLLRAIRLNSLVLVSTLTQGGAAVSRANPSRITPLCLAAYHGLVKICKLFLSEGAKTEAVDSYGWTPLVWAVYKNHPDIVQVLVEAGAKTDVLVTAKQNGIPSLSTPLHIASSQGFIEVAKVLLASEARLKHMEDIKGQTPREVACTTCASSKILLDILS